MYWFLGIIIGIAVVIIIAVILIIILVLPSKEEKKKGDYGDGGGKQIGGREDIPFFASDSDKAGMWAEKEVNYKLRDILRSDEYLLANLLVPGRNNYKAEIDTVLVSRKGIFCIETKRWSGQIIGDDNDEYWIQRFKDKKREEKRHNNPIQQNEIHCQAIEKVLNKKYRVDSAVIFVDLDKDSDIYSSFAFTIKEFVDFYRSLKDAFDISEVESIYNQLVLFVATKEQLKKHKEEMNKKYSYYN